MLSHEMVSRVIERVWLSGGFCGSVCSLVFCGVLWYLSDVVSVGVYVVFFFFQAEDGIRDVAVTGVQTCALPISGRPGRRGQGAVAGHPDQRQRLVLVVPDGQQGQAELGPEDEPGGEEGQPRQPEDRKSVV